ncbi:SGNH/GDSL hydrolase family protein [bacterium]|nr:SGNH/GDSL hydrolase family protein [bacterium]
MKHRFGVIGLACSVCLFFSCQGSRALIREKFETLRNRQEITVVVFGDSISGGRWFSETGTSYASFMKPMMEDVLGCKVSMINSSVADDTYKNAIRRIQEDILSFRPDVVFVMLGFVDSTTSGLYQQVFKKQVEDFMKNLQEHKIFAVILTSTGFRDIENTKDFRYMRLKEFNDIVTYAAALYHYPSIDVCAHMEKVFKTKPDEYRSMFSDPVHLNEKGQIFVAEYIMKSITNTLKKNDR